MLKSLRVPERLFQLAAWGGSLLFASFLIGLGGKIVGDLPGVDQRLTIEQFLDGATLARTRATRDSLFRLQQDRQASRERAGLRLTASADTYRSARSSFENWIATRTATTDPTQDPEVISRTRELDALKASEQAAQAQVDQLDAELLQVAQAQNVLTRDEQARTDAARGRFNQALFQQQLRVFAIRLLLTLPLLVLAGWLVVRKRKSQYWPLARGFVLFALFAFFVELVPYLPSYGGPARYGGGALARSLAVANVDRRLPR